MRLLLAITTAYTISLLFYPTLRLRGIARVMAWLVCTIGVALSPALVPVDRPPPRLFATLAAIVMLIKLFDACWSQRRKNFGLQNTAGSKVVASSGIDADSHRQRGLVWYAIWLINPFWLVESREPPTVPRSDDLQNLAVRSMLTVGATVAMTYVFWLDWSKTPFAVEHTVKLIVAFGGLVTTANLIATLYRLVGIPAYDVFAAPEMAATPGEFWRAWNLPTQHFFDIYVFRPAGGWHHPVRATLVTFAVSAMIHEYVFDIASGRIQGYQTLFFAIHGIATAATFRIRPRGRWRLLGVALMLCFNVATAVIFGWSVREQLPFYSPR